MAFEVVMPRLGWNMESGAVAAWRKRDGEPVAAGEILLEVETEKAVQEVEALESGILRIPAQSPAIGMQVPVGTLLAWLVKPGEQVPGPMRLPDQAPAPSPAAPPPEPEATSAARPRDPVTGRVKISPRARRAAAELGVDWSRLPGTGSTGRIRERDVRAAAAGGRSAADGARPAADGARPAADGARPAAVLSIEVNATDLAWLLEEIGRGGADPAPTPADFIAKAAAHALGDRFGPTARRREASAARTTPVRIALGIEGVPASPVLPDPRPLSLRRFARKSRDLIERARAGRLGPEESGSATLLVRDLGALGIDSCIPALDASSGAVLCVGRIIAKQVVTDAETGRLAIRCTLSLGLVLDPRVADAAVGARFLRQLAAFIEHPCALLFAGSARL